MIVVLLVVASDADCYCLQNDSLECTVLMASTELDISSVGKMATYCRTISMGVQCVDICNKVAACGSKVVVMQLT